MTPSGDSPSDTETPAFALEFESALGAYGGGQIELAELRHVLSDVLCERPDALAAVTPLIDRARENGLLSMAIYRLLLRDIKHITTEDTPTDPNVGRSPPPMPAMPADSPATNLTGAALESKLAPRSPLEPRSRQRVETVGVGTVLRDRYELTREVANGPMGRLFRATDRLREAVGEGEPSLAIKFLSRESCESPDALRRLAQEAFNAQRLSHRNIVKVFEIDRHGEDYFLCMEWLDGETLASRLDTTRPDPMPMPHFRRIFRGLADALSYAHERGIVHGDIKPGNVFLQAGDHVKLIDFGLSRRPLNPTELKADEPPYGLTQSYASREVLLGVDPVRQDDIFALSLIAYRMLAGHRPFGGQTALQAEAEGSAPVRPPDISDGQWAALRSGMAFHRSDRPISVNELADALLHVPSADPQSSGKGLGWLPAIAAAVAAFAVGVGFSTPLLERWQALTVSARSDTPRPVIVDPAIRPPDSAPQSAPEVRPVPPADEAAQPLADPVPEDTLAPTVFVGGDEPAIEESPPPVPVDPSPIDPPPAEIQSDVPSVTEPAAPASVASYAPRVPLGFVQEQYTVNEGDGFVRLGVRAPASLDRPITLQIVAQEGTAVPGDDFAVPAAETIELAPGATEAGVFVPLIADSQAEFIEDFVVRLISLDTEYQVEAGEVIIIILDDDGAAEPGGLSAN